jgi:hypothetical protein
LQFAEAKYEHLYRSLVWRIPLLGDRQAASYKPYKLRCRFRLTSYDLMPDEWVPDAHVEFTMPLATVSNTVIRSVFFRFFFLFLRIIIILFNLFKFNFTIYCLYLLLIIVMKIFTNFL